jgi:hypothetical protein
MSLEMCWCWSTLRGSMSRSTATAHCRSTLPVCCTHTGRSWYVQHK